MQPRVIKYLVDIENAAGLIINFVAAATFDDYVADLKLRSAVERQFEVIGEALKLAQVLHPALRDEITNVARIIRFRNVLAHGYEILDQEAVWAAVSRVPQLLREVRALLGKNGA